MVSVKKAVQYKQKIRVVLPQKYLTSLIFSWKNKIAINRKGFNDIILEIKCEETSYLRNIQIK